MNTRPTASDLHSSRERLSGIRVVACALLTIFLSVLSAWATTVGFQQDVGGYTGTEDTFLQSDPANAGTNNGAVASLGWDDDDPGGSGQDVYSLIRFSTIFGGGAGQVPLGSQITSATLYLTVFDVGDPGEVRNALVSWVESDTFNSFCGSSCDAGAEYGPLVATAPAIAAGEIAINVTSSLQAWSDGGTNHGWFIGPTDGGNGGADVRSSEFGTVSARPRLVVVYDEGPPVVGDLIREPYLTLATPTSQTICWRSDVSSDSRVQYGVSPGSLTNSVVAPAVVSDHCVPVTDLTPATQYWYNVGSSTAVQGGGTADHYFWTHPLAGDTTPFTVWAVGDGGNGTPDQVTVMNAALTEAGPGGLDLAVYLGDIAYNAGTDAEFTNNYFAPYDPVIRNTVVWPAIGNHEGASTTSGQCAPLPCTAGSTGPYYEAFVLPTAAEAGGVASGTEAYYSFDYGNVHFIALNSYNVSRSPTGPMANWLAADLASTDQQWIIAFFHHPPYSKGTHNSDTEIELVEMRENIVPILEAGGVDLVLTGHSHTYERSYLVDGTYTTPTPGFATLEANGNIIDDGDGSLTGDGPYLKSPGPNAHEGAVYVVAGHGGQPVGGTHGHPVMYFGENVKGSCVIDIDANSLTLRNVRITGVVSDNFTIQKGDLPPRVAGTVPPKEAVLSSLTSIEVTFSTGVTGVDASDLTVNGSSATGVVPTGTDVYTFGGFSAPGNGVVSVVLAAGGIADETDPGLLFTGNSWSYTVDDSPPAISSEIPARGSSIGVLPSVTVYFTKPVFNVVAADLLVEGSPATVLSGIDGTAGPYIFSGYAVPGQGQVAAQLLQNGIQDDQGLLFAGDAWTYVLETRLVINEFLASNNTIVADESGGFEDYLEIHNPGGSPVDMSGMYLTNELEDPTRYQIPAGVTIGPGEYLLFWCDYDTGAGPFHTNFNLDKDALTNEDIGLFDTAANGYAFIDGLTYGLQVSDVSSGRFPDGAGGLVSMPPTPAASNTINCSLPAECSGMTGVCTVGNCVGGVCVAEPANNGSTCDDGVSCTVGETCLSGTCSGGASDCPAGQTCNTNLDVCEAVTIDSLPIVEGDDWRYFRGTVEPTPGDLDAWTAIGFDDSSWAGPSPSGFGYGDGDDATLLDATNPPAMQNNYLSLYVRKQFLVGNPATVASLNLSVDFDDAFVCYLNGTQVDRSTNIAGTPPAFNTSASPGHEASGGDTSPQPPQLSNPSPALLVPGTNVLACQGHNAGATSSDFSLIVELSATLGACASDAECTDGLFCNGAETCNLGLGLCEPGTAPDCNDGVACTVDSCNEGTDSCDDTPNHGLCNDSNVCTDDICDSVLDCQNVDNTAPCEDGDLCTGPDQCAGGGCITGPTVDCDDTISCTDDSCDSGTGCHSVDNCPGGETCNLSLGFCETVSSAPPLPIIQGDTWTYFKGTAEPTTPIADLSWAQVGFDDSSWLSGPSGFGYGDISAPNTILSDMQDGYNSVYFRREFSITNPAQVDSLILTVDYDDAFVAYINGVEVVRTAGLLANGSGTPQGVPPTFSQLASFPTNTSPAGDQNHESSGGSGGNPTEVFDIGLGTTTPTPPAGVTSGTFVVYGGTLAGLLQTGNNVIAIHGHNVTHLSTDFVIIPTLSATFNSGCTVNGDCNDGEVCTDDTCNTGTGECVFTPNDSNACSDGEACTDDACTAGSCVSTPDNGNACTDSVACTDDACTAGSCVSTDNCTGGEVCNVSTGLCEVAPTLQTGDVIISGFQPNGPPEWIELFNTTSSAITLDNLELISRLDLDTPDGILDIDWELPAGQLTGASIAPHGFFLIAEAGTVTTPDLDVGGGTGLDLATGEGELRAISLELVIDAAHMDYVVYGRHDGADSSAVPPGDLPFDGVSFPRNEVIRSCAPLSAGQCAATLTNFSDGATQRVSDLDLYAGYDVEGYFTDETTLGDGFPNGVWTSAHAATGGNAPRNSASPAVPPPSGTPCTLDSECDDDDVCNGDETCNLGIGFCQSGTPLVCNDGNVCTDDSCDSIAGCQTTNNTDSCDDVNACTMADVCGAGVCLGTPITCDDGLSCTDDSCHTVLGCQNLDNCPAGQTCNLTTDVCESGGTVIVTFQNDGTYGGTHDTFVQQAAPDAINGALEGWEYDSDDPSGSGLDNIGVLRFDAIVGPGAGQIPQAATIASATLTVEVFDESVAPEGEIRLALVDWDESTATWNSFGGEAGVQPDEVGSLVALGPLTVGSHDIDVTSAVQGWVMNPATNFGLLFVPLATNGLQMRSSEYLADPSQRPKLTVEFVEAAVEAEMSCSLSSPTVPAGGSVGLDVFLASAGGDVGVRGFQTQIQIALTSGSGVLSVPCPGGVFIDEARSDYIFFNETNDSSVTTCSLRRASAAMLTGSTAVGASPVYLSEYTLEVASGTTTGTTFEITFVGSPGSRLADENSQELPLTFGSACTLTVGGCSLDTECDDQNACTTDTCDAGTCQHTAIDCSATGDACNEGMCNPGTGLCEPQPANEGSACDDLDACTVGDVCAGGLCSGPVLDCNDGTACTNDTCVAGSCVYSPSGICSIQGDVFYYRDSTSGGFEPSAKGVPSVDIDVDQDAISDATSASGGGYMVATASSPVLVETMGKFGASTISDHNGAITSFDATFIAQHAVGIGAPLSANQLVAGDVSGNGSVTSFDAAQVAQFAVGLLPGIHFQVAVNTGSDWAFFRCDNYVDATNQDCGPPSYVHDPLSGSEPDDDFHAALYGDVTGNWQPPGGGLTDSVSGPVPSRAGPEADRQLQDRAFGERLRDTAEPDRLALLQRMQGGAVLASVELELVPTNTEVVKGVKRQTYLVVAHDADGIQGLDLELSYEPSRVRVVDVSTGDAATDFTLLSNGLHGRYRIALYGVLPLQGDGSVLELTVDITPGGGRSEPFQASALANERSIPVTIGEGDGIPRAVRHDMAD